MIPVKELKEMKEEAYRKNNLRTLYFVPRSQLTEVTEKYPDGSKKIDMLFGTNHVIVSVVRVTKDACKGG